MQGQDCSRTVDLKLSHYRTSLVTCTIALTGLFAIGDSDELMETHVPMKRLLVVPATDNDIFTLEECNHLKECAECFNTWSEFIHQLIRTGASV